jgi:hypothetical protein
MEQHYRLEADRFEMKNINQALVGTGRMGGTCEAAEAGGRGQRQRG